MLRQAIQGSLLRRANPWQCACFQGYLPSHILLESRFTKIVPNEVGRHVSHTTLAGAQAFKVIDRLSPGEPVQNLEPKGRKRNVNDLPLVSP